METPMFNALAVAVDTSQARAYLSAIVAQSSVNELNSSVLASVLALALVALDAVDLVRSEVVRAVDALDTLFDDGS